MGQFRASSGLSSLGMGQTPALDHLRVGSPLTPTQGPACAGGDEPPLTQHPEFPQHVPAAPASREMERG